MEKLTIGSIIKFRRKKSPGSQLTFIKSLNKPKLITQSTSGGDYWVHSLSTIGRAFVKDSTKRLKTKIDIVEEKYKTSKVTRSRDMFMRNLEILNNFKTFDFSKIKPDSELIYLSKPQDKSILIIKGLSIQVRPTHVYTFTESKVDKIAAVWFVPKLGGYTIEEQAIFTEALYRYLRMNYSKSLEVDKRFCISIDVMNKRSLSYAQILDKNIPLHLDSTLELIKKMAK